jgi:fructose/tagatose bisphosphate aldolase
MIGDRPRSRASRDERARALALGRPPNVERLFPGTAAPIVSGKVIDRALRARGGAMTIAANGRSRAVIRGVLRAAQRADAAIIVELSESESRFCAVTCASLAGQVVRACAELGVTVPVAVHADQFGVRGAADVARGLAEVPALFERGITSIAIDASHLPDDEALLATLALARAVPAWAGLETEVGEIKGADGLSTVEEALFHVRGLNAHGVFPDWIAINNGTAHGIQTADQGIDLERTREIHEALEPYRVSGAQHGTSGNDETTLRRLARETATTKANVATALQMLAWGCEVDEAGNARLDVDGFPIKRRGEGVDDALWATMIERAKREGWRGSDAKRLCGPFEGLLQGQAERVRERMEAAVEGYVHHLLVDVFGAADTAPLAVAAVLEAGSYDVAALAARRESPAAWTEREIRARARDLAAAGPRPGAGGDFDD